MAIAVDVLLAVRIRSDISEVRIANVNPKFPTRSFKLPEEGLVEINSKSLEWSNYFKAGLRGACELLQKKKGSNRSVGMDVMVNGNVPAGGGLSSSAAFVCASALATMIANGEKTVNKKELVEVAIVSERSVGVNSGGYVCYLICCVIYQLTIGHKHGPVGFRLRDEGQRSARLIQAVPQR